MNRAFANTTIAVDFVFWFIAGIALFFLVLVTGLMIWFAIRYNYKRHPEPKPIHEHLWLEITWTLIPTLLVLAMFWYGYRAFLTFRDVPPDALVVQATGQMWKWSFEYPNGKRAAVLYVPLNKPIRIDLKSLDVLHSFYVPAFRIKEDAVPGKANYLWFKPQGLGPADIFCAQYCGLQHSYMLSRVEVLTAADFTAWYASSNTVVAGKPDITQLPGVKLMETKGCLVCHRLDGTRGDGPSLAGLFGTKVTVVEAGQEKEVVADEAYLRRALQQPGKALVKGYDDIMPSDLELTETDVQTIIETLKALK